MSSTDKSTKTESRFVVSRDWEEEYGKWLLMDTGFITGVMKMFWNQIVLRVAQFCKCAKNYWTEYFKTMDLTVHELNIICQINF